MRHFKIFMGLAAACYFLSIPVSYANTMPFGMWVDELKAQAHAKGISRALLDHAFNGMTPNEKVIVLDRKQPEGTKTFTKYLIDTLPSSRVNKGKRLYQENKSLLDRIGRKYNVQPRFIVALWGIETSFGGYTGNFSTVRSLATLAYDGRRGDFFRDELLKALKIIDEGHISLSEMKGSWAGALGQCQFMPSSFFNFAVDYDGDGRKDIWNNKADIFASIANYLSQSGWSDDLTWGRKVKLPSGFDYNLADGQTQMMLSDWAELGVTKSNGGKLPAREIKASITLPGEAHEAAYLVYGNYDVILKWNRSRYFATAVGTLSDRIAGFY